VLVAVGRSLVYAPSFPPPPSATSSAPPNDNLATVAKRRRAVERELWESSTTTSGVTLATMGLLLFGRGEGYCRSPLCVSDSDSDAVESVSSSFYTHTRLAAPKTHPGGGRLRRRTPPPLPRGGGGGGGEGRKYTARLRREGRREGRHGRVLLHLRRSRDGDDQREGTE